MRNSDVCFEENFSALMHGNKSDGRVCVLDVRAARDSPLTNAVNKDFMTFLRPKGGDLVIIS